MQANTLNHCDLIHPHKLLNSIYNGIVAIDATENILFFNPTAETIFKMKKEQALGRPVKKVLPNTGGKLAEVLHTGRAVSGYTLKGKKVTLLANITPVWNDGHILGAVSVFQEISEIEKIVSELDTYKKVNRKLDAVFESSFDGLFITDGEGTILKCNRSSERLIGHHRKDIVGRNVTELIPQGYIDQSVTLEVLKKKASLTILQKIRDGKTIIVTGTPVFDEAGQIEFVVTNERDITALNRMKQRLREYRDLAEKRIAIAAGQPLADADITVVDRKTQQVFQTAEVAAKFETTVLIQGETGVGKGRLARFIHDVSPRKEGPFVHINCGAIPEQLIESELFGYRKGAFTGADPTGKPGLFQTANGGTLFLDEISEIPPAVQVKFLKAIEDRQIQAVGDIRPRPVDVRIIAATNQDIRKQVAAKRFRQDLFFRLNVVPIRIPPLRERADDIFPLITLFLKRLNAKFGSHKTISPAAMDLLTAYPYPGNIRELENVVERIMILCPENEIRPRHLPGSLTFTQGDWADDGPMATGLSLKQALARYERELIMASIRQHGSKAGAARALGVDPSTIVRKCQKYVAQPGSAIMHD